MRISLRLIDQVPTFCISKNELWYKLEDIISYFALQDKAPAGLKNIMDRNGGENFLAFEGIWDYLYVISEYLDQSKKLPEELIVGEETDYLPPILQPPIIFGLAGNCPMTWRKDATPIPSYPVGYVRPLASLTGHKQRVLLKPSVTSFRCATELGVVIGKRGSNIRREEAMYYVFGYTIVNDMISNHWKDYAINSNPSNDPTFTEFLVTSYYGRGSDGFCPMGPTIVSKEEVADPYDLLMWTRVNGELFDRTHTNAMVVGIENAIEHLSAMFTLEPGSVIHMGAMGIDGVTIPEDKKLTQESFMEFEIESLGTLRTYFDDRRES